MKPISILICVIVWCSGIIAQEFTSEHFTIEKLDEGVYAVIHKAGGYAICNSGIVDLGDETLVFDCFISPKAARDLKKAAEELTGNQVKYVVNSHFHNDHIRGNQVFVDADIISTQRTRELIEKNEPEELEWEKSVVDQRIESTQQKISEETDTRKLKELKMWLGYYEAIKESFSDYKITLPNSILIDTMKIKGSEREAILFTRGKAHTESDIVLWLPEEKILFSGDILFVDCHPWLGDGSVIEWIEYLKELKLLNPIKIIPGHGPVGTTEQIDLMISYIGTIIQIVDDAIEKNLTEEEIAATQIPNAFINWWFSRFFVPNISILYDKRTNASEN